MRKCGAIMSSEEISPPAINALAARRGEAVLLVQQDNASRSLIINGINESLEALLGYGKDEVLNRRLETILGKREAELIAEDLEYEDNAPDFGDIFPRIRDVRLRRRMGDEIQVDCTVSRLMAQGEKACFQIVIPNEHDRMVATKLSDFIALNLEGRKELDPTTGLPNYKTAKEFLPLLKNFYAESQVNVVFAMIRMDRHDKSLARYGREACTQLLLHVNHICRSTFRADDLIFSLSDSTLGLVVFNISPESARVVFNRLRLKVRNHRFAFGGKADFSITTCIGFDLLDLNDVTGVFARCEATMNALDASERNMLVEFNKA